MIPFGKLFGNRSKDKTKKKDKPKNKRERNESRRQSFESDATTQRRQSSDIRSGPILSQSALGSGLDNAPLADASSSRIQRPRQGNLRPQIQRQQPDAPIPTADFLRKFDEDFNFDYLLGEFNTNREEVSQRLERKNQKLLNALIRDYGVENQQLIILHTLKDMKLLSREWNMILNQIDDMYKHMPESTRSYGNLGAIASQLVDSDDLFQASLDYKDVSNIPQKAKSMVQYLHRLDKNVNVDIQSGVGPFSGGGISLQHITLTDSDSHNAGEIVAIIETNLGKVLYKPREMSVDSGFNGSGDSIHEIFNGYMTDDFKLPTLNYWPRNGYGYQEFAQHAPELTPAEAESYYRQMGMLTVISKLIGLTDLHADNVRVTPEGKLKVTDAELILDPNVMLANNYSGSALTSALKATETTGGPTKNMFKITGEPYGDIKEALRYRFNKDSAYRRAYISGTDAALSLLQDQRAKEELIPAIIARISQMNDIRVVPVNTSDFKRDLVDYGKSKDKNEVLNSTADLVIEGLETQGWTVVPNVRGQLLSAIDKEYSQGDVPRIILNSQRREISLGGVVVARMETGIDGLINPTLERMANHNVDDIANELLGPVVSPDTDLIDEVLYNPEQSFGTPITNLMDGLNALALGVDVNWDQLKQAINSQYGRWQTAFNKLPPDSPGREQAFDLYHNYLAKLGINSDTLDTLLSLNAQQAAGVNPIFRKFPNIMQAIRQKTDTARSGDQIDLTNDFEQLTTLIEEWRVEYDKIQNSAIREQAQQKFEAMVQTEFDMDINQFNDFIGGPKIIDFP